MLNKFSSQELLHQVGQYLASMDHPYDKEIQVCLNKVTGDIKATP